MIYIVRDVFKRKANHLTWITWDSIPWVIQVSLSGLDKLRMDESLIVAVQAASFSNLETIILVTTAASFFLESYLSQVDNLIDCSIRGLWSFHCYKCYKSYISAVTAYDSILLSFLWQQLRLVVVASSSLTIAIEATFWLSWWFDDTTIQQMRSFILSLTDIVDTSTF